MGVARRGCVGKKDGEAEVIAQIIYRVSGRNPDEKRIRRDFRNTDEGRQSAQMFAATLDDPRTVYIVRARVVGRVVTETFDRRKDADAFGTTLEADKVRGRAIDPRLAKVTVAEFANQWLSERHDIAERTAELYWYHLDRYILPRFGITAIGSVTTSSVRSWHASIARQHPSSAPKSYRLLSAIMRTAVTDRLIPESPCRVENASTEKVKERPTADRRRGPGARREDAGPSPSRRPPRCVLPAPSCRGARTPPP
jgi:Phage integrase, N-terminal SAM-like domain